MTNQDVLFQLKIYDKTSYFSTEVAKGNRIQLLNIFSGRTTLKRFERNNGYFKSKVSFYLIH